jgi:hypothetical protein
MRLIVKPYDEDEDDDDYYFFILLQVMEHQWNEIDRENRRTRGKTCPNATLSTTNPTWTEPESNPGLCGGRPAANRLSHDTAIRRFFVSLAVINHNTELVNKVQLKCTQCFHT